MRIMRIFTVFLPGDETAGAETAAGEGTGAVRAGTGVPACRIPTGWAATGAVRIGAFLMGWKTGAVLAGAAVLTG